MKFAALLVLIMGCASAEPKPVEPVWGKQGCAHCLMLVTEKAPAAQALLTDGSRRFFDDVGCLAAWLEQEQEPTKRLWVRAPGGEGWVDAVTATYSTGHHTPMDFGFIADTTGVTWAEVRASVTAQVTQRRADGAHP